MAARRPHMSFFTSQIFEDAEEGKKHLKIATEEILLAAKSISKVVSSLSVDPDFNQTYPKLSQLLQFGIQTVNQIADKIQSERAASKKKKAKSHGKTRKRKKT